MLRGAREDLERQVPDEKAGTAHEKTDMKIGTAREKSDIKIGTAHEKTNVKIGTAHKKADVEKHSWRYPCVGSVRVHRMPWGKEGELDHVSVDLR
mmetsp:Transcript_173464/g.550673  ORF Transcript_173464/g.550673 Transcript_173464/m.550673 type:complete len:95 (-) Transcript_173464:441-725(-)